MNENNGQEVPFVGKIVCLLVIKMKKNLSEQNSRNVVLIFDFKPRKVMKILQICGIKFLMYH